MRIDDIRKRINNSFLYKRFAYRQSEGFIELMKFLEDEKLIDDFFEECNFKRSRLLKDLKNNKKKISLSDFFAYGEEYSFRFLYSKKGFNFWSNIIFYNKNFQKISDKLL